MTAWWRLAKAGNLPPAAVNGTPRKVYRCPIDGCDFMDPDVEATWAHMWGHPSMNRRATPRAS